MHLHNSLVRIPVSSRPRPAGMFPNLLALILTMALLAACSGPGAPDEAAPAPDEAAPPTATTAAENAPAPTNTPAESASEESASQETNPEEATPAEPAPEETTSEETTSEETTSEETTSEETTSEETTSEETDEVALPTVTPAPEDDTEPANAESAETESTTGQPAAPIFSPEEHPIELIPVAENLSNPLFVTHAGDGSGRIFIVEKGGTIRILQAGTVEQTPFLGITDRVGSSGNEQGLLGLAFAPDYETSGYFFVNYTDRNGDTVVSRFQVSPDNANTADPANEFVILQLAQPARNHNGGMLVFGPDGYLWIGTGDGGGANDTFGNGQNPATLLGKMLRLDVTSDTSVPYTIPADNPWVEADWNGADVQDEAWAVGLRNPWRYSFDRATGDLWIADVGQNQYEEINFTPAQSEGGLNYGWPIMEGLHCFALFSGDCDQTGLVLPVAEYDHGGGHCSVTGGYVYRGSQFPALNGVYIYGDYCSGVMWATWPDGTGGWTTAEILQSGVNLSSFGEDEAGELYVTDLSRGTVQQVGVAQ